MMTRMITRLAAAVLLATAVSRYQEVQLPLPPNRRQLPRLRRPLS